jgi:hypothetical protein
MYLRSRSLTALLSIATVLLGGCLDRPLRPLNPCTVSGVVNEVAVTQINEIDLLFLVDDSASMRQEQDALIDEIPRLVQILASGDLQNGGTTDDFDPVASIQVGVITSDMGIGGVNITPARALHQHHGRRRHPHRPAPRRGRSLSDRARHAPVPHLHGGHGRPG